MSAQQSKAAMSAKPVKTKGPECSFCCRAFRTNSELVQHSLSAAHGADRCCGPCCRIFGTKGGLKAHMKSSIHTKSSSPGPSTKSSKAVIRTASPVVPRHQSCALCNRLFQTKAQFVEHSLDSGHGEDRCCRPCYRLFSTKEALEAHNQSSIHKREARQDTKTSVPQSLHLERSLLCRGNSYRRISQQDQAVIFQTLLSHCHSKSTLQRHGYIIAEAGGNQEQRGRPIDQVTGDETLPLPQSDRSRNTRKAVVLDCEMVGMEDGASELISLAAVDFITGELIVNSLVKPRRPVVDWRTQIHGISPARMSMAHAQGQTLDGWQSATAELFRLVDQDTVLIGHSLQYDLAALHIRPACVVDSAILASDAIFPKKGKPRYWGLGLKDMCSDLLGLNIREGAPLHASNVHDGVEDVLATREVVLCFLERPRMSKAWTTEKRNTFWKGQTRKVPHGKNKPQRRQKPPRPNDEDDDYLSYEILRWEDVIDYDMWPKSPPDSD